MLITVGMEKMMRVNIAERDVHSGVLKVVSSMIRIFARLNGQTVREGDLYRTWLFSLFIPYQNPFFPCLSFMACRWWAPGTFFMWKPRGLAKRCVSQPIGRYQGSLQPNKSEERRKPFYLGFPTRPLFHFSVATLDNIDCQAFSVLL